MVIRKEETNIDFPLDSPMRRVDDNMFTGTLRRVLSFIKWELNIMLQFFYVATLEEALSLSDNDLNYMDWLDSFVCSDLIWIEA